MMISCPECSARYDVPSNRLSAGGLLMRCASCGHGWMESRQNDIIDLSPSRLPVLAGSSFEPDREVSRLVEAAREAQESFAAARHRKLRRAGGWAGLGAFITAPFALALLFAETVVAFAPAAAPLYQRVGMEVNIYGLEIRKVEQQHMIDGDARVLAVKGEIWNVSGAERKVPAVRLALKNELGEDTYVWTVESGVRPLAPGGATVFTTRVQDPPMAAETVELRFARKEEMGSNNAP